MGFVLSDLAEDSADNREGGEYKIELVVPDKGKSIYPPRFGFRMPGNKLCYFSIVSRGKEIHCGRALSVCYNVEGHGV